MMPRFKLILNGLRELWYRIAYDSLSFSSLKPDSIDVGYQEPDEAVHWIPSVEVADQIKQAYFTHPPSQLNYQLKVPSRCVFRAFVTLKPEAWGKNTDGVEFNVSISSKNNGESTSCKVFSHPTVFQKHRQWQELSLNLKKFANQEVNLTLSTSTPMDGSTNYAWAIWGNPAILSRGLSLKMWRLCTVPFRILMDFFYFVRNIYQNSYMIRTLVRRDLRGRYVGSFLGLFWSFIHPLSQICIYYFVFSVILKVKLGPEYGGMSFTIWLIAGLLPWMFFAEVVTRSPTAVLEQANLITKMVFPSEILPFCHLIAASINHFISMGLFVVFLYIVGYGLSFKFLLVLPILFSTCLFALGLSWMLSALNVFLRDIGQIIGVVVNIWFFLTPIIYPRHVIPEKYQGLYGLNPMLHAVEGYRTALLGKMDFNMESLLYLFVPALVMFALGGLVFKKLKPAFVDTI